jgi:hypothetical protein
MIVDKAHTNRKTNGILIVEVALVTKYVLETSGQIPFPGKLSADNAFLQLTHVQTINALSKSQPVAVKLLPNVKQIAEPTTNA